MLYAEDIEIAINGTVVHRSKSDMWDTQDQDCTPDARSSQLFLIMGHAVVQQCDKGSGIAGKILQGSTIVVNRTTHSTLSEIIPKGAESNMDSLLREVLSGLYSSLS